MIATDYVKRYQTVIPSITARAVETEYIVQGVIKEIAEQARRGQVIDTREQFTTFDTSHLGYWFDPTGVIKGMHKVRAHLDHVLDGIIQEHMDLGSGKLPSIISTILDTPGVTQLDHKAIKACISDMLAGTDTSTMTKEWAMTEIIWHPKIQHELQAELDAVVDYNRVVEEGDMTNFPYLTSIVKEMLRLHPTNCLALPWPSVRDAELAVL